MNSAVAGSQLIEPGMCLLDRYEVLASLGTGASGWVYRAVDLQLDGQTIALKVLYPHLLAQPSILERFHNEILLTRKLSHPHIVQTFNFERVSEDCSFITMQCIDGCTARERYLAPHPVDLDESTRRTEVLQVMYHIATALLYAHDSGIIHRDLKPDNILVTNNAVGYVADFGIAEVLRHRTRVENKAGIVGTPYDMAPEQFEGAILTTRSDIYSFGMIAFELLLGERPFQGSSLYQLANAHLTQMLTFPAHAEHLHSEIRDLIAHCAQKEPKSRPESMGHVCETLEAVLDLPPGLRPTGEKSFVQEPPSQTWQHISKEAVPAARFLISFFATIGIAAFVISFFAHPAWLIGSCSSLAIAYSVLRSSMERRIIMGLTAAMVILFAARTNHEVRRIGCITLFTLEQSLGLALPPLKAFLKFPYRVDDPEGIIAAAKSDREALEALLMTGTDPNLQNSSGWGALHSAVSADSASAIEILMAWGADLNLQDKRGETPLHVASRAQCYRCLLYMKNGSLDPNIVNRQGETPLYIATTLGNDGIVSILLKRGANPNLTPPEKPTALHIAVRNQSAGKVDALLREGAEVNAKDRNGFTPLHLAVQANPNGLHFLEIIQRLIEQGANPLASSLSGATPLDLAVRNNAPRAVQYLRTVSGQAK